MKKFLSIQFLVVVSFLAATHPAYAVVVLFDFDTGTPSLSAGTNTPLVQTSSGVTAIFSSPLSSNAYSVQNGGTTFLTLSQFSGNYLYPNSLAMNYLDIHFDRSLTNITFPFATADFNQTELPTTVQLTAYQDSAANPAVGTVSAMGTYGSDSMPMGTLAFNSGGNSFNLVRIGIPFQPLGASDFLVDNIQITAADISPGPGPVASPVPDPASALLFSTGLAGFWRRKKT